MSQVNILKTAQSYGKLGSYMSAEMWRKSAKDNLAVKT